MKNIVILCVLLFQANLSAHEGDSGPSSLENEFSRTSHLHLPVSYSTTHGLSFGLAVGAHEHEEHGHEEEHDDSEADDSGLEFNIHPTVTGGFDKIHRLVNLEESTNSDFQIEAADESSNYLLLESKKWDLGLGLGADIHLPNPLFAFGIAVSKVIGKNYYSMKVLEHKHEKRAPLLLPTSEANIATWKTGDKISYSTRGSFIFSVLVGIEPFFHIGPSYSHSGVYRVTAHMEDEKTLEVEIATLETNSISFEADALVVGANAGITKGHSNTIVYTFDISDEKVFTALSYLFEGRLDLVNQKLLGSGGTINAKSDLIISSTSASAFYGFPVLFNAGSNRSNNYQEGRMVEYHSPAETHESNVYIFTAYRDSFTRGLLSKHKWENNSVASTIITGEDSLLSTIFSWSFSKDQISASKLKKKLQKIARTLPMASLKEVQFPFHNLGYVKADVSVNFSGGDVLFLLNTKEMIGVKNKALLQLESDFKTYGHRAFCKIRSYQNCLSRYKNLITNKHQALRTLTHAVDGSYKKKQFKSVTSGITKMVKTLFGSRYLTEAFVSMRPTLEMKVQFEGEKIKKTSFQRN